MHEVVSYQTREVLCNSSLIRPQYQMFYHRYLKNNYNTHKYADSMCMVLIIPKSLINECMHECMCVRPLITFIGIDSPFQQLLESD